MCVKTFPECKSLYLCPMEEKVKQYLQEISKVFMQYGVRTTSMDDIARHLGISKKTLYQYFSDKNDVVKQVISHNMEEINSLFQGLMVEKSNAIETLIEVSKILINHFGKLSSTVSNDLKKYYPEAAKLLEEHRSTHVLENIEKNLHKGIKEGIYRDDLDVKIIAYFYLLRMDHMLSFEVQEDMQEYPMEKLVRELFIYHIRGIANEKGIAYLEKKLEEN
ncbi:MAG: hypothetical protein C0592_07580 [Marinilabiliales bacterium]|nr:MAG: hypothetical protein C0592_07580 [Marinilabiliales bacterium]